MTRRPGVDANDWMPRMVDHAEDKYDEHAQAAMREAEAAISDHGAQIGLRSFLEIAMNHGRPPAIVL